MNEMFLTIREKSKNVFWTVPFAVTCLWIIDAFCSIFVTGFSAPDIWLMASIVFKICVIVCNMFFVFTLFIAGKTSLYGTFKTIAGYGAVLVYVIYAFPRLSWGTNGLISQSRAAGLLVLNILSSAFPSFLYLVLWNRKTQNGWKETNTETQSAGESGANPVPQKRRSIIGFIFENVNILIQAILIVILIQHFIFQPYLIPSESMVPTFLVNDRPFVTKLQSGPTIPLSDVRLPVLAEPKRGNIVVFENPTYEQNDLAKKMFQHFVFLATFSLVDIDPQKRFIVKRVIAEPGEKIMMVDDIVYIKKKGESGFRVLETDKRSYAHIDLYNENERVKKRIGNLMITKEGRESFLKWDALKNENTQDGLYDIAMSLRSEILSGLSHSEMLFLERFFAHAENTTASLGLGDQYSINTGRVFAKYIAAGSKPPARPPAESNLYIASGKRLNLIFQIIGLRKMKASLGFLRSGIRQAEIFFKPDIAAIDDELSGFADYINSYDKRNCPEFPEGEGSYIPVGQYFLMGDNRYNSFDFRFADEEYMRKLDPDDQYSFTYLSILKPHTLDEKNILGFALFRMWPPDRFGLVK
jgi:signal peptidase I